MCWTENPVNVVRVHGGPHKNIKLWAFIMIKEYHWLCEYCEVEFESKNKLYKHWKEYPEHHIKKSSATHKGEYYCKYCGRFLDQLNSLHRHEKSCKENPNRVPGSSYGIKMSEEFRKRRSENMKERHKNGTAPTFADLRRREEPSYPEQWLIKVIENENLNKNYVREKRFHTFSLDFCWPELKKVIEMDGRLHKISEYQKDCDRRKDELLKQEGYEELRIDWEYCFNHTQEIIKQIKEFIGE